MIKKLKNLLIKIDIILLSKIEKFRYSSIKDKFQVLIMFILILDLIIFSISYSLNYNDFLKKENSYNSQKENVLIQEQINGDNSSLSFKDTISLIDKTNINHVEFFRTKESTYAKAFIITNDKFLFKLSNIFSYSISTNIEPFLLEENISYNWTNIDSSLTTVSKPELIKPELIITKFIMEHFLQILIYGFLFFYISRSMPGLADKKFDIVLPNEIESDLDNLVGMDPQIKLEILQLKDMISNFAAYSKHGIQNFFNIMLSGPAGTGKSRIALGLAKALDLPVVIGTGNVETGFVGGGASTIKNMFRTAEKLAFNNKYKTAIIFLDESQTLMVKRGNSSQKWADDSANELLAQLDGVNSERNVNIIFIAASNFDDSNMQIDEAMERRFKKKIYFKLPDKAQRAEIIEFYIDKINEELVDIKKSDIDILAGVSTGLSPAKIETIINEASLTAIRKKCLIDNSLLIESFERIVVGLTSRENNGKSNNRNRIVYHELGHFIAEFSKFDNSGMSLEEIKSELKLIKISSESISKYNVLGFVMNETSSDLKTKKDLEEEIISLYGGYAAEDHFYPSDSEDNVSTGAFNDIEKVTMILKSMVVDLGMYSKSKINLTILKETNNAKSLEKIHEISERLYLIAKDRISRNEDLIQFLSEILMEEWTLDKDSLFESIEKFKNMEA